MADFDDNKALKGEAYGWDSPIVTMGGGGYELLSPGYGLARVTSLRHEQFGGSEKMEAAPRAALILDVTDCGGARARVVERVILNTRLSWKLEEVAKAFGVIDPDAQEGTTFRMPWDDLVGKEAYCEIGHREYNGIEYNDVKRFVYGDEAEKAADVLGTDTAA